MSLNLGEPGHRLVQHEGSETFHLDRPVVGKKKTVTEERQLINPVSYTHLTLPTILRV